MADDPLLMALGAAGDDLALLRPGGSGMNFSLHVSGSGATTSDGSGRLNKRRRGAQQDGDEVRGWLCFLQWIVMTRCTSLYFIGSCLQCSVSATLCIF
jgi:hypothetical protein